MNQQSQNSIEYDYVASNRTIPRIDITGKRFGKLTAIEFVRVSDTNTAWRCVCDCGNERTINGYFLRSGATTHCGCEGNCVYGVFTETHSKKGTHFPCWAGMMTRCFNPKGSGYYKYGAKGITVCSCFQHSYNIPKILGERPSRKHQLHRLSNDGNYSCGSCEDCKSNGWKLNVEWADHNTQARLRSNNTMLTYKGETMCMKDLAEKHGISYYVLRNRIGRQQMSVENAIETPLKPKHLVEYRGKTYVLRELTKEKGVNYNTVRGRLSKGWSIEDAIHKPLLHPDYKNGYTNAE